MADIRSVLIVGGGASGWMAAAFLERFLNSNANIPPTQITLLESPDVPIIGVGEATIPSLTSTLEYVGIDELQLLRRTEGAFKQAIRYQGWGNPASEDDYFYHPFDYGVQQVYDLMGHHWIQQNPNARPWEFGRALSAQCRVCDHYLAPFDPNTRGKGLELRYAYHTDAVLLSGLLREVATGRGVTHLQGKIKNVELAADGSIASVVTEDGRSVSADLFVDCSGFHGLLLTKALGEPFLPFSSSLLCDRAFAVQKRAVPGAPLSPYTKARALSSGWSWDIELQHRHGTGYVFSSNHISEQQAMDEFIALVGEKNLLSGFDPRLIKMRVGRHERLWVKNCVAIGLAGGFIEPLESTGIYLSELGVRGLTEYWPSGDNWEVMRKGYNQRMSHFYQELLEFIVFHYKVAGRRDTDFWRDAAESVVVPPRLAERLELWRHRFPLTDEGVGGIVFNHQSYQYILAGMQPGVGRGYRPIGLYRPGESDDILKGVKKLGDRYLLNLPNHRTMLAGLAPAPVVFR